MMFADLPINIPLLVFDIAILIRSVFEGDDTYCPHILLEEALYDKEKYGHVSYL